MIFAIAEWGRSGTLAMWHKSKQDRIASNFNPEVATGGDSSPAQQDNGVEFLELASSFELILIYGTEHIRETTLLEHALCVLTES
jgi:hypothetical protein